MAFDPGFARMLTSHMTRDQAGISLHPGYLVLQCFDYIRQEVVCRNQLYFWAFVSITSV